MLSTHPADLEEILGSLMAAEGLEVTAIEVDRLESTPSGIRCGVVVHLGGDGDATPAEAYAFIEDAGPADDAVQPGAEPVLLEDEDGDRIRVWVHPNDPWLPALPAASVPIAADVLLRRLGRAESITDLALLSYRPGRRAVLRLTTDAAVRYLKIVRPRKAESLRELHDVFLTADVPVPAVEAFSPDGLMLIGELAGPTAGARLGDLVDEPRFLDALDALVARIREVPLAVPSRGGPMERPDWYLATLTRLLPDDVHGLDAIARAVAAAPEPVIDGVRHGDLHLEQLIVDEVEPWRITGLLDIDTAGTGDTGTELACAVAQLEVRAVMEGDPDADRLARAIDGRFRGGDEAWDRGVACQLIAHAVGPAGAGDRDGAIALLTRAAARLGVIGRA